MKRYFGYWAMIILLSVACQVTEPGPDEVVASLGTIQATIGGSAVVFASKGGTDESTANGFTPSFGLLGIFRQVSAQDLRRIQVTITGIDLDGLTVPTTVAQNAQLRFFLGGSNQRYDASGPDLTLRIVSKQGDVLRGTFSGTLRSIQNPNEVLRVGNGSFNLALRRF